MDHCRDVGRDPTEVALSCGVNAMLWGRARDAVEARFRREAAEHSLSEPERRRLAHSLESAVRTPQEAAALVERYVEAGATYVTVGRPTLEGLQMFADEVIPRFRSGPEKAGHGPVGA